MQLTTNTYYTDLINHNTYHKPMSADPSLVHFAAGNYRFVPGGFQYCAAVVADDGYLIERARFDRPVPLAEGFDRIRQHLLAMGRPPTALCACELRSPRPMAEPDFIAFNRDYVRPLADWGLYRNEVNPVARCNLVPVHAPPPQTSVFAFSYTAPALQRPVSPDFVTSGAAECPDRPGYRDAIVRLGETSPEALAEKIAFALGDLESRFALMRVGWGELSGMNLYTAHPLHLGMEQEIQGRAAPRCGFTVHRVRPPVIDIEIELDARRVSRELLLPA